MHKYKVSPSSCLIEWIDYNTGFNTLIVSYLAICSLSDESSELESKDSDFSFLGHSVHVCMVLFLISASKSLSSSL